MEWLSELGRRLQQLLRWRQWEDDLAEEMRLHVELRAAEKAGEGVSPRDAEAQAKRRFGNATQLKEKSRGVWGWAFWDALAQDVRYAIRTLAANKGFALAAILSLTLGMGANTALFSIVNAVMLRILPVKDPRQLVQLSFGSRPHPANWLTNPIWEAVRDSEQAFDGTLAYSTDRFDLANGGESHFANTLWVSGDFFRVLGVPAWRGRVITKEDDVHGGGRYGPVAVISYAFWQAHFAGDPNVLGKSISLERHNFQIAGVTPAWFRGVVVDRGFDVAIPIGCEPLIHTDRSALGARSWWWLRIMGRLKPGETLEQAEARINSIAPEIAGATVPTNWNPGMQRSFLKRRFVLKPGATGFSPTAREYGTALIALMTVVGLVLLIACVNIANLLLARATARQREFSIRLAIGASRVRLIRQLLTESLLLAAAGATGGLLVSIWGARLLVRLLSTKDGQLDIDLAPDPIVFGFTAGVALLTGLLFGLVPALRATRADANQALKENSRGAARGGSRLTLGKMLATLQVAISIVLLATAALFLGSLRNFLNLDLGFNPHQVLVVNVAIPQDRIAKNLRTPLFEKILDDIRNIPNVRYAASSMFTPISRRQWNQNVRPEGYRPQGYQPQPGEEDTLVYFNGVSPGYFRTAEIRMLAGRDFSDRDTLAAPRVMIVGETTARHFWSNANPIGKSIEMLSADGHNEGYQVIGVVRDVIYGDLGDPVYKTAYVSNTQDAEPRSGLSFEIRFDGRLDAVTAAVRDTIAAVNKDASLEFETMDAHISDAMVQPRVVALLSSFFGFLALLLATIGLYGVISYAAARRRGEIGIRMALGAAQHAVTWLVLRDVIYMLAIGTVFGVALSLAGGRFVKSLLFGIQASNPEMLALAAAVLCAAALLAAYLPARRAAKMDPMIALREE